MNEEDERNQIPLDLTIERLERITLLHPGAPKHVTFQDQSEPKSRNEEHPLDEVVALALDAGAAHIAAEARRVRRHELTTGQTLVVQRRQLCRCLGHHLWELRGALACTADDANGTVNTISLLRVLAEAMILEREAQPDADRDHLAAWLKSQRRRFLMATTVDAVVALDDRLGRVTGPRIELRRVAALAVGDIVADSITGFRDRLRAETETQLGLVTKRFLTDIERSFGALSDTLPVGIVAGVPMSPRAFTDSDVNQSVRVRSPLAHRIGAASRQTIARAARNELSETLERASRRLILRILHDYDDLRAALEHHFCHVLDGCLESARYAVHFASSARVEGCDGVARARSRIDRWYTTLSTITSRIS